MPVGIRVIDRIQDMVDYAGLPTPTVGGNPTNKTYVDAISIAYVAADAIVVAAYIAADAAHLGAANPHPQYALESALGTLSTQNSNNVSITGGAISGITLSATNATLTTPALGTPSAIVLTNATGLPVGGLTGLGTNVATFLATPTSANLAAAVTNESGDGALLFANGNIGAATGTSLALGGATLGGNVLALTGASLFTGATVVQDNNAALPIRWNAGTSTHFLECYTSEYLATQPAFYIGYLGDINTQRWVNISGVQRTTGSKEIVLGFTEPLMLNIWMDVDLGIGMRLSAGIENDQSYLLFKSCGDNVPATADPAGGNYRFRLDGATRLWWGDSATMAGLDTNLYRGGVNTLKTDGALIVTGAGSFANLTATKASSGTVLSLGANATEGLFLVGYDTGTGGASGDVTLTGGFYGPLQLASINNKDINLLPNGTGKVNVTGALAVSGAVAIGGGTPVAKALSATAALNFGSVAAGASAELTIAVTGAVAGDGVRVTPNGAPEADLTWCGYPGTDVVTVRIDNTNLLSAVDPASRTWRAEVIKY